jgi:hypothetical protein
MKVECPRCFGTPRPAQAELGRGTRQPRNGTVEITQFEDVKKAPGKD